MRPILHHEGKTAGFKEEAPYMEGLFLAGRGMIIDIKKATAHHGGFHLYSKVFKA